MKSTGEQGNPTRESPVSGIRLAKAFYKQWSRQGPSVRFGHLSPRSLVFGGGVDEVQDVAEGWNEMIFRGPSSPNPSRIP